MMWRAVPRALRRRVRDRAGNCCEYCRHPAAYSCAPFVCEHIEPRVRGAGNSMSELAWASLLAIGEHPAGVK
jgi:hypothetical protein